MAFITVSHLLEKSGCKIIGMTPEDHGELKIAFSSILEVNERTSITYDPGLKRLFASYIPGNLIDLSFNFYHDEKIILKLQFISPN